ncbi:MAG: transcription termination factor Rho [Lachnospiraceae bacterium]|nr:transcription termination factor Rho [Lachnospiraceae bacterium]
MKKADLVEAMLKEDERVKEQESDREKSATEKADKKEAQKGSEAKSVTGEKAQSDKKRSVKSEAGAHTVGDTDSKHEASARTAEKSGLGAGEDVTGAGSQNGVNISKDSRVNASTANRAGAGNESISDTRTKSKVNAGAENKANGNAATGANAGTASRTGASTDNGTDENTANRSNANAANRLGAGNRGNGNTANRLNAGTKAGQNEHTPQEKAVIFMDPTAAKRDFKKRPLGTSAERALKGSFETAPRKFDDGDNEEEPRSDALVKATVKAIAEDRQFAPKNEAYDINMFPKELDSGEVASGILEIMPEGYGFIRCENYMPGENDVYVSPSQIRKFGLKTGDILTGNKRVKTQNEKFSALLYVSDVNGFTPAQAAKRVAFEDLTPIFPNKRIKLERAGATVAARVMDLICPVGKGQRGMIVSPPKAGKTTLIKEVAKSILVNHPDMKMIILLIDERPEEVTDIKEAIQGSNVEVIYSTFDELPEHHKRVSEMVIERAKRLVEHKHDVVILLDSITRLTRAYNLVVPASGRTLSGGLDPAALHMPKRFFGAARNMREGGSLTILATALVDTGSKMDDVVYEEFKGTGNMEMVLDRKLSEKRIFPAIDLAKSGTRREDLLLNDDELAAINIMRKALNGLKNEEATDKILDSFAKTKNNSQFVEVVKKRFVN